MYISYMSKIDDLIRAVNQVLPSVQLVKLICMQSNDINIHKPESNYRTVHISQIGHPLVLRA